MSEKIELDILAIGAHRDDCDIMAGGTIIKMGEMGYKVGILDLTEGEMGTRGNAETRAKEAFCAACALGVAHRENMSLPDTRVEVTYENRIKMIEVIRRLKPKVILAPYWDQKHPDHVHTAELVKEAVFYSGLKKYDIGEGPHRPRKILYYLPFSFGITPSFFVDICDQFEKKIRAIKCFYSQFVDIQADMHLTPYLDGILERVEYYNGYFGRAVKVKYAEGFVSTEPILLDSIMDMRVHTF
jgi:bacillithiol biosynthesis deacetylase BshB1